MCKAETTTAGSSMMAGPEATPRRHRWRTLAEPCDLCGKRPGVFGNVGFGLISDGHRERCARRKAARKTRSVKLTQADSDEEEERINAPLKTPEQAASQQGLLFDRPSVAAWGQALSPRTKTPAKAASQEERPFNLRPSVATWCQAKPPQSKTPAQAASQEAQAVNLHPFVATCGQAKPLQCETPAEEFIVSSSPLAEQSEDEPLSTPVWKGRSNTKQMTCETVSTRIPHGSDRGSSSSEYDCFDISTPRSSRSEIGGELMPESVQVPLVSAQQVTSTATFKEVAQEGRAVDLGPSVDESCQGMSPQVLSTLAEAASQEAQAATLRPFVDTWPVVLRPFVETFPKTPAQAAALEPRAVNLQPFLDMCCQPKAPMNLRPFVDTWKTPVLAERPVFRPLYDTLKTPAEVASAQVARPVTLRPFVDTWKTPQPAFRPLYDTLKTPAEVASAQFAQPVNLRPFVDTWKTPQPVFRPLYDMWKTPAEAEQPVFRPLVDTWKFPAQDVSSQAAPLVSLRPFVDTWKTPAQEARPRSLRPLAETVPRKLRPFVDTWFQAKLPQVETSAEAMEISAMTRFGDGRVETAGIKMSGSFLCLDNCQKVESETANHQESGGMSLRSCLAGVALMRALPAQLRARQRHVQAQRRVAAASLAFA